MGRAGFCFDDYHNTSWDHCLRLYRWELETDATVLQRRQKQIDYGKRTPGYQCFLQQVPKWVQLWVVTRVSTTWLFFNVRWWKDTKIWMLPQSCNITKLSCNLVPQINFQDFFLNGTSYTWPIRLLKALFVFANEFFFFHFHLMPPCACINYFSCTSVDSFWPYGPQPQEIPSVCGILQTWILEWVAMPSSRGSSWPRDRTCISYISCIDRRVLYH